jgi:hypothetical protein
MSSDLVLLAFTAPRLASDPQDFGMDMRVILSCVRELTSTYQDFMGRVPVALAVLQVSLMVVVRQWLQQGHSRSMSQEVLELLQLVPLLHEEDYDMCLDWAVKEGAISCQKCA